MLQKLSAGKHAALYLIVDFKLPVLKLFERDVNDERTNNEGS